ncbi:MAG: carboxypeptidase-like regulatory domain-containing protein [Cryomorphaceae bacterium]|nr:carboxypeptidase-like regulatory domain-containing protein [Flavobacteriales bacterium]
MGIFKNILLLIVMPVQAFLLTSCNDDDFPEPPATTNIEGRVFTQNEFGQPLYDERSGVSVYLETGFRNFNVMGNNTGVYRLSNAPTGTYIMRYSKNNFGTVEKNGLRVITTNPRFEIIDGFQQIPSVTLTKLPTTSFNSVQAVLNGNPEQGTPLTLSISATMVPPPPPTGQAKGYRIFVGIGNSVTRQNYIFQKHVTSTVEDLEDVLEEELFGSIPNTPGSVLSVVLYGDANFDESYENQTGQIIFPNLSVEPSAVVSVIIP